MTPGSDPINPVAGLGQRVARVSRPVGIAREADFVFMGRETHATRARPIRRRAYDEWGLSQTGLPLPTNFVGGAALA
jgi:hypothetical protein